MSLGWVGVPSKGRSQSETDSGGGTRLLCPNSGYLGFSRSSDIGTVGAAEAKVVKPRARAVENLVKSILNERKGPALMLLENSKN